MVSRIWSDFRGLRRVCGTAVALKWVAMIAARFGACRAMGSLQPADIAVGEGPLRVTYAGRTSLVGGVKLISHLRELWVRGVYLDGGFLSLPTEGVVVDLGANRGYFTALAATAAPDAKIVAVEASPMACEAIRQLVALNHWENRVTLVPHFIGGRTSAQDDKAIVPDADGIAYIPQDELMARHDLSRIDFLKCDIEGSEFELLTPGSPLLKAARQLAVEVHDFAGDRAGFIAMLKKEGFETRVHSADANGCIVQAKRMDAA